MPEIYQPAEDSIFLNEFVEKEISKLKNKSKMKILDMGSGSGIQAGTAIDGDIPPENLTLADINPDSVNFLKSEFPESKVILSDLFSGLKKEKYGLIIFNPPYLPENKFDKKPDTTGGEKGSEAINKFLKQAKSHLSAKGIILLLTSSFSKGIIWGNYRKTLLGEKKIFFEELHVWKLQLAS
ncbi:MAG TPA: methyltransferase [Candidatus Omnitrophota bacterium]|nr:methyltransferase [Candidatus Omnitrophota bacterium]